MDKINESILSSVAQKGEKHAAEALSILAKKKVNITTTDAKTVSPSEVSKSLESIKEHMIVAYTQAITGVQGLSVLAIERHAALELVDLFNGRAPGTTKVMKEIDRSTITETLNILANSYVANLANEMKNIITLSVPRMVTSSNVEGLTKDILKSKDATDAVVFNTELSVEESEFEIKLSFFFFAVNESDPKEEAEAITNN